jgi:[ribosomal protein S18]-alanine N-acetyltransferase
MIDLLARMLARPEPVLSEAGPRDAAALAALHAAAFGRGWSEDEFERLLLERNVIAHRAMSSRTLAGFVLSRLAGGEAEILSIAVATARRGRGLARRLLDLHLRRLAGLGATAVFLEVDEDNLAARRLYARAGFRDVGRRPAYYPRAANLAANALVLRRDLA